MRSRASPADRFGRFVRAAGAGQRAGHGVDIRPAGWRHRTGLVLGGAEAPAAGQEPGAGGQAEPGQGQPPTAGQGREALALAVAVGALGEEHRAARAAGQAESRRRRCRRRPGERWRRATGRPGRRPDRSRHRRRGRSTGRCRPEGWPRSCPAAATSPSPAVRTVRTPSTSGAAAPSGRRGAGSPAGQDRRLVEDRLQPLAGAGPTGHEMAAALHEAAEGVGFLAGQAGRIEHHVPSLPGSRTDGSRSPRRRSTWRPNRLSSSAHADTPSARSE